MSSPDLRSVAGDYQTQGHATREDSFLSPCFRGWMFRGAAGMHRPHFYYQAPRGPTRGAVTNLKATSCCGRDFQPDGCRFAHQDAYLGIKAAGRHCDASGPRNSRCSCYTNDPGAGQRKQPKT
jgi:hypothetical protein